MDLDTKGNEIADILRTVIDMATDAIITIDDKGLMESVNYAAQALFGYEKEALLGKNVSMLMPEPDHSKHDLYLANYQQTRKPKIIGIGRQVIAKRKDGSLFPIRLAVSEVILHNRVVYTGIIHDVSEIVEVREALENANKDLEKRVSDRTYELESVVNKLLSTNAELEASIDQRKQIEQALEQALIKEQALGELKTRFVSMASHEFRTPLTSIQSSASLILRYPGADQQEQREKHVDRIKSAVQNLTGILNDFLSLSKLDEGKVAARFSYFKMPDLCHEVMEETEAIRQGRPLEYHIEGDKDLDIYSDPRMLKNILFNLVTNAFKYSQKPVKCSIVIRDDSLKIEVADQGIGIPYEDQPHMFSRFFRAGNVTNIQGTGLGLNIVQRYVDLLQGEITFDSVPDEGTTFTVTMPIARER